MKRKNPRGLVKAEKQKNHLTGVRSVALRCIGQRGAVLAPVVPFLFAVYELANFVPGHFTSRRFKL